MDKDELRARLSSLTTVENVFPTRRVDRREFSLFDMAQAVEESDTGTARDLSFGIAREVVDDLVAVHDHALDQLVELSGATEQLAAFARAGFVFFETVSDYAERTLQERRAIGGNAAVTRVLAAPDNVVLETERLVVGFAPDVDEAGADDALRGSGLVEIRRLPYTRDARHVIATSGLALNVALGLLEDDRVEYAEPDFIEYVGVRQTPPTQQGSQQWHHAALGLPNVWPDFDGHGIRIAIVDTGFDVAHPDLALAADGSGWYRASPDGDDAVFVSGVQNMRVGTDHGTACAGMAAALATDAGRSGVAFAARLSAVACLPDQVGPQSALARALAFAADPGQEGLDAPGSDLVACSLGPNGARWEMRRLLADAIDFVTQRAKEGAGLPLFWAVTNGNYPIASDEVCSHPNVIAVGRSTADRDDGSGFGPELDFLAPGVDVLLPTLNGDYRVRTGTSFACPCAAGVAALLLAKDPSLSPDQVRQTMRSTCRQIGDIPYVDGRNDTFGSGRIDAEACLAALA